MFSPTLAMVSATVSAMVTLPTLAARILSTSAPAPSATLAIIFTRPWNKSLRATKSVSEFTSTRMPLVAATATPIRPSAASRPAFFAALDRPFLRSQSTAASRLPALSLSAALQSIMPAPVWSRSSLTMDALIFVICCAPLHFLGGHFLGLGDPAFDTARKPDLFADIVRGGRREFRDLLEMENAEVVELLFDRRRHGRQFLEIVGYPARP